MPWSLFYPYLVNDFYSEIGYRLSGIEKNNFLAFSQHHGIPTNLIDVTANPLTALYFACQKGTKRPARETGKGYVYIFDNHYVDITSIMEKDSLKSSSIDLSYNNRLTLLIGCFEYSSVRSFMIGILVDLIALINDKLVESPYSEDFSNIKITEDLQDNFKRCSTMEIEEFKELFADIDQFRKEIREIAAKIDKGCKFVPEQISRDDTVFEYLTLFLFYIKERNNNKEPGDRMFDCLPNLIYRPKILFERARLQDGYFIVQATYDNHLRQRIKHTTSIEIENKDKILD